MQIKCSKCFKSEFWRTADKRLKCKNCQYIFTPKSNPFNISNQILKEIISEFLLEHSTNIILERVKVSKYKLLKVLAATRMSMAFDLPEELHNLIKKNALNLKPEKNIENPVIGILSKGKKVYAKILPNITSEDLEFLIKKNEKIQLFEGWQKNMGLIFKGSLYRLFPTEEKKYQIDTIATFWGYLKRKLSSKGGIRKEKLPLYLGEYAWRYNHQKLTLKEQEEKLLKLIIPDS